MACCKSCEHGAPCGAATLGAPPLAGRAWTRARKWPAHGCLPGAACPPGLVCCNGHPPCRHPWQCIHAPIVQAAQLGALPTAARWFHVNANAWGQIGWFYGTDMEAAVLPTRPIDPCEHTGHACIPFPGVGDDFPPRSRFWELWDRKTWQWRGWLHSDQKGALLVSMGGGIGGMTLGAAPQSAIVASGVPLPPVGRPSGAAPAQGARKVGLGNTASGSRSKGSIVAGVICAAGVVAGVVLTR